MRPLRRDWLKSAYREYVINWLWDDGWGYQSGWIKRFSRMVLWYSTAGSAVLSSSVADIFDELLAKGRQTLLPVRRQATWLAAKQLANKICIGEQSNPVDWFTGGCGKIEFGWKMLDDIPEVGPKIASFILRDLSFMRDHSDGSGCISVNYTNRKSTSWFRQLSAEEQGLFLPIDTYVCSGARRQRASCTAKRFSLSTIQTNADIHRKTSAEIAVWSRKRGMDPRCVNVYWYYLGAGYINKDGTPTA